VHVVVADAGPLNYLILTETIDVLPVLFQQVVAPEVVRAELLHGNAPARVRAWADDPPEWMVFVGVPHDSGADIATIDEGERAAIALSMTLNPALFKLLLARDRAWRGGT
jgi:predicted nucleic acid-binding protein